MINDEVLFYKEEKIKSIPQLLWDTDLNKLSLSVTINATTIEGDGLGIVNLSPNNLNSLVPIEKGGTNSSNFGDNTLIFYKDNQLQSASNIYWSNQLNLLNINCRLNAKEIYVSGINVLELNPDRITTTIPINKGGTGEINYSNNNLNNDDNLSSRVKLFYFALYNKVFFKSFFIFFCLNKCLNNVIGVRNASVILAIAKHNLSFPIKHVEELQISFGHKRPEEPKATQGCAIYLAFCCFIHNVFLGQVFRLAVMFVRSRLRVLIKDSIIFSKATNAIGAHK